MVGATRGHLYATQEHGQEKIKGRGRGRGEGHRDPPLIQPTLPPSHTIKPYPQSKFKNDQSTSLYRRLAAQSLPFQHTTAKTPNDTTSEHIPPQLTPSEPIPPQPNRQSTSPQPSPQPNPLQSAPPHPNPQTNPPQQTPNSVSQQSEHSSQSIPQPRPLQPTSSPSLTPLHSSSHITMNERNCLNTSNTQVGATIPTAKSISTLGRIELRLVETKDNTFSMHPSSELSKRITASFHKRLADFWPTFGKIPSNYKDLLFEDFLGQVYGYDAYPIETIRKHWKTKASKRYSDMVSDIKEKNAKPIFMSQAIWDKWLQYWDLPEVKEKSKKASTNRNSNPTLHSCGSISTQEHAERLSKEYGRPARVLEVFEHTRIKAAVRNKEGSTPPTWIDPKAEKFYDNLMRACAEQLTTLRETTGDDTVELPSDTIDTIFESLVVPNAKKRFYPIGNLELPSYSQRSKRHCIGDEEDVHELQKTVEEMRLELENERAERLKIEAERESERAKSQKLEEEQARLAQQQKADRENFQAQMAKVMAMLQRHDGSDYEDLSPSSSS